MKVDTNTKGNTYWFMYKISEFRIGQTYRFNILNFTRDLAIFYRKGINLVTKVEKKDEQDVEDSQWRYGRCKNVVFQSNGDVPRTVTKDNNNTRYFSKLSFSYTFSEEDHGGKVVFAYAIPYSYTDLQVDLENVKLNMMVNENFVLFEDLKKADNAENKTE